MSQPKCSCSSFERLEGASLPAYTKAFLEQSAEPASPEKKRFRCRFCGRLWERREHAHEGGRPSLVRIS